MIMEPSENLDVGSFALLCLLCTFPFRFLHFPPQRFVGERASVLVTKRLTMCLNTAWNFVRINELVLDAGYGSTDGFFFNASGLQWEGRGEGVFKGWLGTSSSFHDLLPPKVESNGLA